MNTRQFILDLQMFAEDQPNKDQQEAQDNSNQKYIDALAEMKANTVSKEKFKELEAENKKLLNAVINGDSVESNREAKKEASIEELRGSLFGKERNQNMTNLEFCTKALELREKLMEQGEADPFVPQGRKVSATYEDYAQAERVAQGLKEAIAAADGDPVAFNGELHRRGL